MVNDYVQLPLQTLITLLWWERNKIRERWKSLMSRDKSLSDPIGHVNLLFSITRLRIKWIQNRPFNNHFIKLFLFIDFLVPRISSSFNLISVAWKTLIWNRAVTAWRNFTERENNVATLHCHFWYFQQKA